MEWGGKIVFSHGTFAVRGCAILIKRSNTDIGKNVIKSDTEGRFIIADISYAGCILTLINIYAPNVDSPGFFENLLEQTCDNGNKVVIGDYNLTMDVKLDKKNSSFNNNNARNFLIQYMEQHYFEEIWRARNPETKHYSWHKNSSASRIDFALVSKGFTTNVENITYSTGLHTDHSAVFMSIMCHKNFFFFFFKVFGGHMSFFGATGTPVLDFW